MEEVLSGTPFFVKGLTSHRSMFTGGLSYLGIMTSGPHTIEGHSVNEDRLQAGMAAIGEAVERYTMSTRSSYIKGFELNAFNLAKRQSIKLPLSEVLYASARSVLPPGVEKGAFCDSLGGASHVNSYDVIERAWLELIERQSLIYNWLTRSPGTPIDSSLLDGPLVHRTAAFFDAVQLFEISLHSEISVVIAIGSSEKFMGVGVAARYDLRGATNAALREMLGGVWTHSPWRTADASAEAADISGIENSYVKQFYATYTPTKLLADYAYLSRGHIQPIVAQPNAGSTRTSMGNMVRIAADLHFEPVLALVPGDISRFRVMKCIALGGYPHLRTDIIKPEHYAISYCRGSVSFPNAGRVLPFA